MEQPMDNASAQNPANPTPAQPGQQHDALLARQIKRRNFIAFGSFVVLQATAFGGWKWLTTQPQELHTAATAGQKLPFRRALNQTELFFRRFFSNNHLVKTYPKEMAATHVRVNGFEGMASNFKPENWKLKLVKAHGEVLTVGIDELKALPKTDIIYDFKCVEGWDQIQHWAGVKFADVVAHFGLEKEAQMEYASFVTPDNGYYVGIDMPSALHPQTILAYEMNDKPIPVGNGAPLRLIIPVKYGIKNLKRIASISFSNTRPPDYWAEKGYDYYSGL